jgi:DNA-3-methyladenine glycosylase II
MEAQPLAESELRPVLPFNFALSCSINTRFGRGAHTSFVDGSLYKCFEESEAPILLKISVSDGHLIARLFGSGFKGQPEAMANWIISSDLSLKTFYLKASGPMSDLVKSLNGVKPLRTGTIFEALLIAITEQQISLKVAQNFQNRLVDRYGKSIAKDGITFRTFPSPARLSILDPSKLKEVGLSTNKSNFITGVSKRIASGELDLESLKGMTTEKAREHLLSIRGVGPWTADYVLIRGLGRVEMVPYEDLGIRDAVGLFYRGGHRVTSDEAEEILSEYGSYAGLAAYYLIFARMFRSGKV